MLFISRFKCIIVCVHMHACIHVCVHACIGVWPFSSLYMRSYMCMCACMRVCTFYNTPPPPHKVLMLGMPPPTILKSFLRIWFISDMFKMVRFFVVMHGPLNVYGGGGRGGGIRVGYSTCHICLVWHLWKVWHLTSLNSFSTMWSLIQHVF